jgi:hypothetical protein
MLHRRYKKRFSKIRKQIESQKGIDSASGHEILTKLASDSLCHRNYCTGYTGILGYCLSFV